MNSKNILGFGLIAVTAALACVLASSAGEPATHFVGKAAWYLPYVSLVGAIHCLVRL